MMTKTKFQKKASLKAMDYLAIRDHSEKELREKLSKNYSPEEVDQALEYVISHGWLLPPEELSLKVADSLHLKNKSHFYIVQFLRQKGLPEVEKQDHLELEKAHYIVSSKAKDLTDHQHLHSLLKNRGFDTDIIWKVIDEIRTSTPNV